MAALILAAKGEIDFPIFVFCNTGDDSEDPRTLKYVRDVMIPYGEAYGIEMVWLEPYRGRTLLQRIKTTNGLVIPVRLDRTGKPARRACTTDYKIRAQRRWAKQYIERNGYMWGRVQIGVGFSADELNRIKPPRYEEKCFYPLIEDPYMMTTLDCINLIQREGLPLPPKSACWFCPYASMQRNLELKRERPDLFQRKCELEAYLTERRANDGYGPIYMHDVGYKYKLPLDKAVELVEMQGELFPIEEVTTQSYYCDGIFCDV